MVRDPDFHSTCQVIDPMLIAQLAQLDADLGASLLQDGIASLRQRLAELQTGMDAWSSQVHCIKGLAASLGAARLADAAGHAENADDVARRASWIGIMRRELAHLEMRLPSAA
jgi:HPt (histidine-containing phosphotransfer) domain-containing protein